MTKGPGYFELKYSLLLDEKYLSPIKATVIIMAEINIACNPNTL
jgi:hypothetical protein